MALKGIKDEKFLQVTKKTLQVGISARAVLSLFQQQIKFTI